MRQPEDRPLRIAMIGQRGVPATFGGVEHHVEQLGRRLVERGHTVVVYSRRNYVDPPVEQHLGMQVRIVPTLSTKSLDALVHSGFATVDACRPGFDILHYHAIGPGFWTPLARYVGRKKVIQTIHGHDQDRAKWGLLGRTFLNLAAALSGRVPHATVTVSQTLAAAYRERYDNQAIYIPNGVEKSTVRPPQEITERFGLTAGSYVLFMGRLVPEKAPDLLIKAFRRMAPKGVKLVVAGGSSFTDDFVRDLQRLAEADDRIVMPGYVYGQMKEELYSNAAAFVLPSSLEGLPLTLLEAMSYGSPVVASDIPPHKEVIPEPGPGRRLFRSGDVDDLASALRDALDDPQQEREAAAECAHETLSHYDWDRATDELERLYRRLAR